MRISFLSVAMETKLDLTFLIDGSQAVTEENFLRFLSFTKAITASLEVSKERTHVNVAVYGDNSSAIAYNYHNQTSLYYAIDSVKYPASLQSNLGEAMLHIVSKLYNTTNARSNVTKILVILTASKCHDDITVPSYLLLKYYNVKVFVFAVGSQYSMGQLNEVSSDPDIDYVHTVNSGQDIFDQLVSFKDMLGQGRDALAIIYILTS